VNAELVISSLEAAGTVSAVVLALFLQVILVRFRRPRLHLTLSTDIADQDAVGVVDPAGNGQAAWIRVRVWNYPKKRQADNVQVLVHYIETPADAENDPYRASTGEVLNWAETATETINIPAGIWRRVDILQARVNFAELQASSVWWLCLHRVNDRYPAPKRHWMTEQGDYCIGLIATADDCDPSYWTLTFRYVPDTNAESATSVIAQFQTLQVQPGKEYGKTPWTT